MHRSSFMASLIIKYLVRCYLCVQGWNQHMVSFMAILILSVFQRMGAVPYPKSHQMYDEGKEQINSALIPVLGEDG
jgi:hypothetical protein